MRSLSVFNSVTVDGYIADPDGDMSFAHRAADPEWTAFVEGNAKGKVELLFGRVTYDLMASYWPTPAAKESDPVVAAGMNDAPKVVFSRTMKRPAWQNTRLVKDDLAGEVRRMKKAKGPDMLIFGSATIIAQLSAEGLIDIYQMVVCPVALGAGKSMFAGMGRHLDLRRTDARTFANGNVVLTYETMR